MFDAEDFDVLIVGGGLVGASLAAALAPLPLKVAVVEAFPFGSRGQPSFDDRVAALSWGSRRILESMGLWAELASEAQPIRHIHVSDRGRLGAARFSAAEMQVDALGYVVPNWVLGRALTDFLAPRQNVTLLAPAKLKNFEAHPDRVEAAVDMQGERRLTARLLVAADGAHSQVREQLGIEASVWEYGQTAAICNVAVERPQTDWAYERFTDSGPLALLPLGGERYALIWTVPTENAAAVLALNDETFAVEAAERFGGRLGSFTKVGKRQSYELSLVRAASQHQGRVVIAGNAAHSLHPIAGQGFNLSLRDVAMLAEVLAAASTEGRDVGEAAPLERYVAARRGDQLGTSLFTDGLTRVFSNPLLGVAWARNAGLLAMELLPEARRRLMEHNMGIAGPQPRLARGVSLP